VSEPNALGQHAFVARLKGGARAVYVLSPDGTLSLILKTGTLTALGKISQIPSGVAAGESYGVAVNSQGQIILPLRLEGSGETLVLLTPTAS
jgi:hypothetical protein